MTCRLWDASRFRGDFRLIDNPEYIETSNGTCILNGLTLRVVEVGRDTHHNIPYLMTQIGLSGLLHEEVDEILIADHLGSIFVIVEVASTRDAVVIVATPEVVDVEVTPILEGVFVEGSLSSSGRTLIVGLVSAPHIFVVGPLSL